MSLLWNRGPLFVREMLECFPEPRPHFNTVSTTVRNLEEKGYVGHEVVGGTADMLLSSLPIEILPGTAAPIAGQSNKGRTSEKQ